MIERDSDREHPESASTNTFVLLQTTPLYTDWEENTRVKSPQTFPRKSKLACLFHFLFSPRTNTSINCPRTFFSVNPSTSATLRVNRTSIWGLFAKFDSSIHTKSDCSCSLSVIIECKYPRKGSSINNALNDSSRAERFINAAIACCDVFAVYCKIPVREEQVHFCLE